ncbi:hypothetical protein RHMOL_Rhmol01G0119500 [Rhododendron molle]|uniref:Uncharacterized protein n=1 Tax=Rhododendron molle TaxID=49168 RepID=A0ACC0Q2D5_RHOML|nr:hypothetical protein RHMOL_Rhmol01G0119500 [Rhododendron molle]
MPVCFHFLLMCFMAQVCCAYKTSHLISPELSAFGCKCHLIVEYFSSSRWILWLRENWYKSPSWEKLDWDPGVLAYAIKRSCNIRIFILTLEVDEDGKDDDDMDEDDDDDPV